MERGKDKHRATASLSLTFCVCVLVCVCGIAKKLMRVYKRGEKHPTFFYCQFRDPINNTYNKAHLKC